MVSVFLFLTSLTVITSEFIHGAASGLSSLFLSEQYSVVSSLPFHLLLDICIVSVT